MKNKTWAVILGVLLAVCLAISALLLLPGQKARQAQIWSEGKLVKTVELAQDQTFAVETDRGINVITVKDGKIAVTEASCPDHYCMDRGYCDRGIQIVCLPNRLEIRFVDTAGVDGVSG